MKRNHCVWRAQICPLIGSLSSLRLAIRNLLIECSLNLISQIDTIQPMWLELSFIEYSN